MTALWTSFVVVALAEMGDKTQLHRVHARLSISTSWTVMLGILIATVCNHALASSVGVWVAALLPPSWLAWIFGLRLHRLRGLDAGTGPRARSGRAATLGAGADDGSGVLHGRDGRQDPAGHSWPSARALTPWWR